MFTILDVDSIFILSSILDEYLEVKVRARNRQYSSCLLLLWTKVTRILTRSTWKHRVLHSTCIKNEETSKHGVLGRHQPCSKERIEVLSVTIECYHSSRNTSKLIVFQKLLEWKLEESYMKVYISPRPPPKISFKHELRMDSIS